MYETENDDFDLIETEYELIDEADAPDPNKWQSYVLSLEEMDCASGVCWHQGAKQKQPAPNKPTQEQELDARLRDVASWFVQMENKFISTQCKDPDWVEPKWKSFCHKCWLTNSQTTKLWRKTQAK